jgi:drug/metabolite transporter (DMT)-like permease
MFRFGSNSLGLLGIILIFVGIVFASLSFLRSDLFKRQDLVLVVTAFICGGIFLSGRKYLDGVEEFTLYLLTIPAIFYAIDVIRLRAKQSR